MGSTLTPALSSANASSSRASVQRTVPEDEVSSSSISSEDRNAVKAMLEKTLAVGQKQKLTKGAVYTADETKGRTSVFGDRIESSDSNESGEISNTTALSKPKIAGRGKKRPTQNTKFQTAPQTLATNESQSKGFFFGGGGGGGRITESYLMCCDILLINFF